jgi:pimeloyl-ACP methyl ester carboxylesterase
VSVRLVRHGPDGGRRPLLVVPGIDGSEGSVAPIVARLAERRPVVVADYTAETNRTLEELSVEIAAAAAALPSRLDLLGQSIGTIVAAQLAGRGLVAADRVALVGTFTRLRWRLLAASNALAGLTPDWLYHLTAVPLMALVCGPVGDGWDHPFFAAARRSGRAGIVKRTGWEIGRDFSADLAALRSPALVLVGAQDRFVPDVGHLEKELAALFAGRPASVCVIPRAGHVLLPSAAIAEAARRIEEFLDG